MYFNAVQEDLWIKKVVVRDSGNVGSIVRDWS